MFSFEEYVMFQALSDSMKKALAEKFAAKRIPSEEAKIIKQMGTSYVDAWAQKQIDTM